MNEYLQRAHDALSQSAGSLTLDQLTARPPGKWTIGEILEHLSRAFSHTSTGAQRAIVAGQPSARRRDARSRFRAFVVVRCGYLPTGVESPKMVVPVGIDPAVALSTAVAELRRMHATLDEAEAKFGGRVKLMDHPIIGALSVREWRRFHWVHTRHHVRQIRARILGGSSG